jgi:hypothetical protein
MIDLISIVFRDEIPLLRIQAESINQYIDSDKINCITIVVNDTDDVVDLVDTSWYNHKNVQVIAYSKWQYQCRINGWENQQLCKLLAASESTAEWSLSLDAKTWFSKPFNIDQLFDEQHRGRVGRCNVFPVFESSAKFVEELYQLKMTEIIGPHGVPFLFHTQTAKELIESQTDFIDFFQTNVRHPIFLVEFHIYTGFVLKKYLTLDTLYSCDQYCIPVNIAHYEWESFDHLFDQMQKPEVSTVSIHRKVYPHLTSEQYQAWVDFLVDKKILQDPAYLKFG